MLPANPAPRGASLSQPSHSCPTLQIISSANLVAYPSRPIAPCPEPGSVIDTLLSPRSPDPPCLVLSKDRMAQARRDATKKALAVEASSPPRAIRGMATGEASLGPPTPQDGNEKSEWLKKREDIAERQRRLRGSIGGGATIQSHKTAYAAGEAFYEALPPHTKTKQKPKPEQDISLGYMPPSQCPPPTSWFLTDPEERKKEKRKKNKTNKTAFVWFLLQAGQGAAAASTSPATNGSVRNGNLQATPAVPLSAEPSPIPLPTRHTSLFFTGGIPRP